MVAPLWTLRPSVGRFAATALTAVLLAFFPYLHQPPPASWAPHPHPRTPRTTQTMPLLRMPWVSGAYRIDVGYSYLCGDHQNYTYPGSKYHDSYAIDFDLPSGTPVAAVADGIAFSGNDGATTNYGMYVWIAHTNPDGSMNGYVSVYAHLSDNSLIPPTGVAVKQGQMIGLSGSTGNSTGPHLHFSLRSGATSIQDGTPAVPEPMSGYTGFGQYGQNHCANLILGRRGNHYSPYYNASPWIDYAADVANTSYNPYETTIGTGNVAQLTTEWTALQGVESGFEPVVDDGMVFVTENFGTLYALSQATGKIVWQKPLGGVTNATPVVYNGTVYVSDITHHIYAFDATTGTPSWIKPGGSVVTDYTVASGTLFVGSDANISSSNPFYAYDAETGVQKWMISLPCLIQAPPAVSGNILLVGCSGTLYAFNATTGTTLWSQPQAANSAPAVANGFVYDGSTFITGTCNECLVAYDLQTGTPLWNYNLGVLINAIPAVANGIVYIDSASGTQQNYLFALDYLTGVLLWSQPINEPTRNIAVANGVVYISANGFLYAYDANTGAQLWSSSAVIGPASPVIANGRVYLWYAQPYSLASLHVPGT